MKRPILFGLLSAAVLFVGCGKGANLKELGRNASRCDRLQEIHDVYTACPDSFSCDDPSDNYVSCAEDWPTEYCESVTRGGSNAFTACVDPFDGGSRNNGGSFNNGDEFNNGDGFNNGGWSNNGIVSNNGTVSNNSEEGPCFHACLAMEFEAGQFCGLEQGHCDHLRGAECTSEELGSIDCGRQHPESYCRFVANPGGSAGEPYVRCVDDVRNGSTRNNGQPSEGCYEKCLQIDSNMESICPEVGYSCGVDLNENCSDSILQEFDCRLSYPEGTCSLFEGDSTPETEMLLECLDNVP